MSAPAASTALASSPRRVKSAASIEGEMRRGRDGIGGGTYINDAVGGPSIASGAARIFSVARSRSSRANVGSAEAVAQLRHARGAVARAGDVDVVLDLVHDAGRDRRIGRVAPHHRRGTASWRSDLDRVAGGNAVSRGHARRLPFGGLD